MCPKSYSLPSIIAWHLLSSASLSRIPTNFSFSYQINEKKKFENCTTTHNEYQLMYSNWLHCTFFKADIYFLSVVLNCLNLSSTFMNINVHKNLTSLMSCRIEDGFSFGSRNFPVVAVWPISSAVHCSAWRQKKGLFQINRLKLSVNDLKGNHTFHVLFPCVQWCTLFSAIVKHGIWEVKGYALLKFC